MVAALEHEWVFLQQHLKKWQLQLKVMCLQAGLLEIYMEDQTIEIQSHINPEISCVGEFRYISTWTKTGID